LGYLPSLSRVGCPSPRRDRKGAFSPFFRGGNCSRVKKKRRQQFFFFVLAEYGIPLTLSPPLKEKRDAAPSPFPFSDAPLWSSFFFPPFPPFSPLFFSKGWKISTSLYFPPNACSDYWSFLPEVGVENLLLFFSHFPSLELRLPPIRKKRSPTPPLLSPARRIVMYFSPVIEGKKDNPPSFFNPFAPTFDGSGFFSFLPVEKEERKGPPFFPPEHFPSCKNRRPRRPFSLFLAP